MATEASSSSAGGGGKVSNMAQLKMPFPWKLYHMLEEAEKPVGGFHNIVSWLPDGKAFKIYDQQTFADTAMQQYFNQSKIKSFTRQLYIYGFLKVPSGPNEGAFYHPEFIRGNKESCFSLRRNQAGDRRRIKVSRRGSASSYNSVGSSESYDSGSQGGRPPTPITSGTAFSSSSHHSSSVQQTPLGTVKAQRRSSLSDYVIGRPTPPQPDPSMFPMGPSGVGGRQQRRRSSMGAAFPLQPSDYTFGNNNNGNNHMNFPLNFQLHHQQSNNSSSNMFQQQQQQQQQNVSPKRRNSLSEFFERAISLLPSDAAYANLPCLEDLNLEPTPIGSMSVQNNSMNGTGHSSSHYVQQHQQHQQQQQFYQQHQQPFQSSPPMQSIDIGGLTPFSTTATTTNNNNNVDTQSGGHNSDNLDDLEDNEDDYNNSNSDDLILGDDSFGGGGAGGMNANPISIDDNDLRYLYGGGGNGSGGGGNMSSLDNPSPTHGSVQQSYNNRTTDAFYFQDLAP